MAVFLHHDDLPEGVDFGPSVAIDTETMGLNPLRDRLCLVQLSSGDGDAHCQLLSCGIVGGVLAQHSYQGQSTQAVRLAKLHKKTRENAATVG